MQISFAQQSKSIVSYSDNRETTHHLTSGNTGFQIGISANAGGIINEIKIPFADKNSNDWDIMDIQTDQYGRSGQSSIRDDAHRGRYNPTQAGFNEFLGTKCLIVDENNTSLNKGITTNKKMIVGPYQLALWKADGDYDFTQYEGPVTNLPKKGNNLYDDSYSPVDKTNPDHSTSNPNDTVLIPGDSSNSDEDNLVEDSTITHADEIGSPFNYVGTYENYEGLTVDNQKIKTAVIRHYYEYRYDMKPNHSLEQFVNGFIRKDAGKKDDPSYAGQRILDPSKFTKVTLPNNPSLLKDSPYKTTYQDLSYLSCAWSIRMDIARWAPKWRHVLLEDGTWFTQNRTIIKALKNNKAQAFSDFFMLSEDPSSNGTSGKSLAFYRPKSEVNKFPIIGREADGNFINKYEYERNSEFNINDSFTRTPTMSWIGFKGKFDAIINPNALQGNNYETYREEYYLFYGTPTEIKEAKRILDNYLKISISSKDAKDFGARKLKSSLAANEIEKPYDLLYPNPSSNGVFKLPLKSSYVVTNENDKTILTGKGNVLDLSKFQAGIYFVKIENRIFKLFR